MTLQEIKNQYPKEWVLIEYDRLDENFEVQEGLVIAHSPSKEEIYKALSQTFGKNVSLEYTGPVEQDLAVMFFIS